MKIREGRLYFFFFLKKHARCEKIHETVKCRKETWFAKSNMYSFSTKNYLTRNKIIQEESIAKPSETSREITSEQDFDRKIYYVKLFSKEFKLIRNSVSHFTKCHRKISQVVDDLLQLLRFRGTFTIFIYLFTFFVWQHSSTNSQSSEFTQTRKFSRLGIFFRIKISEIQNFKIR